MCRLGFVLGLGTGLGAGAFPMAATATAPGSVSVFDGGHRVDVHRIDDRLLDWDGVRVGYDRHALVWLEDAEAEESLKRLDLEVVDWPSRPLGIARVLGRSTEDGLDIAARLQAEVGRTLQGALPDIRIPHRPRTVSVPPDDPRYAAQWYFDRIGLEGAWKLETGDETVTVVVIDNGCDLSHPDLASKIAGGLDVVDGDDDPSYEPGVRGNEHGTACAGLIAAETDNRLGIAGACPECRVQCVRLLTDDPRGTPLSADVAAFQHALDVGADVVSNSWGFADPMAAPEPLRAIIQRVIDQGREGAGGIVVFAVGNDNRTIETDELQAIPGVIGVGATNNFDESTPFSNRGRAVDVVAPTGTLSTDISGEEGRADGDYTAFFGGTSAACPIVAGVAALLVSADPDITATEVQRLLTRTAEQSFFATPGTDGHDALYGFGLVRPEAALRELLGRPPPASDGGTGDAGVADAAGRDAGARPSDPSDGGAASDGGTPRDDSDGGSGCVHAPRTAGNTVLWLLVVFFGARWRSRTRPHPPGETMNSPH